MQQQLVHMQPIMASYYPNNVTTDHIQQYLDENKTLILKIVESQNSGKLSECAENQSRLQRNLMYLAAIADSQSQQPEMPGQYTPGGIMQQGAAHYMQAQQMTQQQQLMAARSSLLYAQQPFSVLQQQQALHSQLGMSSSGSQGLHMLQSEAINVGGNGGFPDFVRSSTGNGHGLQGAGRGLIGSGKQEIGSSAEDRRGSARGSGGHSGLKSADDGN
ncbi:GRF1-interacting factor 1-like isoform X2 [Gastrolobium bilobum]|uniref:GRF1-interacting factor 1-like isoform X2 n=1 Tax=Gastrolobium bilobum TaxID=150636 RepID=UPI002AB2A16A|nr:GRF1-interacting factor 1-like isoform X2 [Gastrolobium bilobum]